MDQDRSYKKLEVTLQIINLKKNDNVLAREMFQDSNLNKVARDRDVAMVKQKS